MNNSEKKIHNEDWLKIIRNYNKPDVFESYKQLISAFVPFILIWYLSYKSIVFNYSYLLTISLSLFNGLFLTKIFIIMHDCGHGSFLKSRKQRDIIGFICGVLTLTPYHTWARIHTIHHKESGNLDHRIVGDFPLLTKKEYQEAPAYKKFFYSLIKSPIIIIFLLPFVLFFILHRLPASKEEFRFKKIHKRNVLWTNLAILALVITLGSIIGYKNLFLIQFPINIMMGTIGVYFFYVQHNFENTYWSKKENISYFDQAMKGSSYMILPRILDFIFMGINYHHIHHLCPKIPGYNLKKCYEENELFHNVTSFTFLDSFKELKFVTWDESENKLLSFKDLSKDK